MYRHPNVYIRCHEELINAYTLNNDVEGAMRLFFSHFEAEFVSNYDPKTIYNVLLCVSKNKKWHYIEVYILYIYICMYVMYICMDVCMYVIYVYM